MAPVLQGNMPDHVPISRRVASAAAAHLNEKVSLFTEDNTKVTERGEYTNGLGFSSNSHHAPNQCPGIDPSSQPHPNRRLPVPSDFVSQERDAVPDCTGCDRVSRADSTGGFGERDGMLRRAFTLRAVRFYPRADIPTRDIAPDERSSEPCSPDARIEIRSDDACKSGHRERDEVR
ncbi:unnamed protein product [Boreogadus saida]